jgi:hypothetical protein
VVITGAKIKQAIRIINNESEIFNLRESDFLILPELIIVIGKNIISNNDNILSINDILLIADKFAGFTKSE